MDQILTTPLTAQLNPNLRRDNVLAASFKSNDHDRNNNRYDRGYDNRRNNQRRPGLRDLY